jgi:hypothetical protein
LFLGISWPSKNEPSRWNSENGKEEGYEKEEESYFEGDQGWCP